MTTFSTGSQRFKRTGRYAADTAVSRPWKTPGGQPLGHQHQVICCINAQINLQSFYTFLSAQNKEGMYSCRSLQKHQLGGSKLQILPWMH